MADIERARRAAAAQPASTPARPLRVYVDEDRDVVIPQGIGFVTFRPGEKLDDPYRLALAREYGIALRER